MALYQRIYQQIPHFLWIFPNMVSRIHRNGLVGGSLTFCESQCNNKEEELLRVKDKLSHSDGFED